MYDDEYARVYTYNSATFFGLSAAYLRFIRISYDKSALLLSTLVCTLTTSQLSTGGSKYKFRLVARCISQIERDR